MPGERSRAQSMHYGTRFNRYKDNIFLASSGGAGGKGRCQFSSAQLWREAPSVGEVKYKLRNLVISSSVISSTRRSA